jgi:eukaryotic-like serine/threonine-protein kinase
MAGAWTPSHWLHWNGPWSRASTLTPGTLVSRHLRLVRPVVDLGVQNTWVAEHLALKREVSVTFHVPGSSAASLTASADAEHLLGQSSALSHVRLAEPHFVHVIEQGTANGGVAFIVTELLEGMSLRHRLAHGHPLSLEEAEHVVTQVAGALATAHAAGVAHGSLCPEMLFLSEVLGKPFVKVLGLGATFDSADARASESATQAYTSPEQLLGATGRDGQGDLWALAVSLYELLTTILPFEAPTPAGVTVAICNAQFSAPSHYRADLPPAIDAWFARALSKSVTNRFRDAGALARAFALATGRGGAADQAATLAPSTRVGDEQDEDEMTVRWDVPGEWPATNPPRAGSVSGPNAPAALPSSSLPGAPPPLPNRIASSRPPPSLDSTAATGFSLSPPTSAALPRDSYLAAVASALAVPASSPAAALPASLPMRAAAPAVSAAAMSPAGMSLAAMSLAANATSSRALDRRLILAASLLSVLAVAAAWLYSSNGSSSSGSSQATKGAPALQAASDSTPIVAVTVRAEDLPEVGSDDEPAIANERELPQIIQTHDLPPAPEEGVEEGPSDVELTASDSPTARAGVPSSVARHVAAPSATRAVAGTTPRSTRSQTAGQATCNPPYYFDANNIRRLKLECLGGPVQKKHALTPAAPARNKPLAGNQARAGASCTPPYYFDRNNIRRLKLECL